MKKYIVHLVGWDFSTDQEIEAESAAKAKGKYIKEHLKDFLDGYPKQIFFQCLRCKLIKI